MFITNSPAPSRINSAELPQRDVTVWEFAIFGYFPCIIRTVRTRSFNHKHKHRKMAIFCYFFSRFFLFLELGIFLFKLGKKHTFWHWEHDRISVIKTGQKKPWAELPFLHSACHLMLIDICIKFHENCLSGFQIIEWTRFVTDRQTDRETPGEKTICLPTLKGGDIDINKKIS